MWLLIIIVCIIFGFACQPVDRLIKKKVSTRWLAVIVQLIAYWVILMALYGLAALLGFESD